MVAKLNKEKNVAIIEKTTVSSMLLLEFCADKNFKTGGLVLKIAIEEDDIGNDVFHAVLLLNGTVASVATYKALVQYINANFY